MEYTQHYSVLKSECLNFLSEKAPAGEVSYFADLTFGGGGHSFGFLSLDPNYKVIATDQDPDALKNGIERIRNEKVQDRITLFDTNFVDFPSFIVDHEKSIFKNHGGFQGILIDLGVSSHHFDEAERGFSYRFDGPLDMRMDYDNDQIQTAADVVNTYPEKDLVEIFSNYGEERYSKRIAAKICEERKSQRIETTKQLENLIFHCYPKDERHGKTNPSTRIFQALRIEVNQELRVLTDVIPQLLPLLKVGGRLGIISFHSLEDRIVKNIFRENAKIGDIPFELITKKPIIPTDKEILENSRSRSAKLRIIERVLEKKEKNKYKDIRR